VDPLHGPCHQELHKLHLASHSALGIQNRESICWKQLLQLGRQKDGDEKLRTSLRMCEKRQDHCPSHDIINAWSSETIVTWHLIINFYCAI